MRNNNLIYLCQWAPAACPGFLLVTFGTVGALTSIDFFESGLPPLNTGGQWNPKPRNSPHNAGILILFESFLGILLVDPRFFFHHIVAQVRPSIWQIKSSSPLLWNPRYSEKGNLPDPFVCTFSFVMPFSYESEHTKLMTSLITNLSLGVFYLQI